ncbi:MAG: crossover junction endodeoxyribonuclease RuvC [Ignavibacteriae bacterium]|nr:crossover junction endodeoxyribonuclease RuvC [Ignavibacteriota bacterium]
MRIIGIDPGTAVTGIGIIEYDKKDFSLIHFETINLNQKNSIPDRLKIIYDNCLSCIRKYKPDEFAIETAFYGKNIQSTLKLGQARGVAIIAALNSDLKISEYSPREIKKSVTGNGASSKEQVKYMVKSILSAGKTDIPVDSSDALAIAICHSYQLQNSFSNNTGKTKSNTWHSFVQKNPDRILKSNVGRSGI